MDAVIDPTEMKVVGFVQPNSFLCGPWTGFITLPVPEDMDQETLGVESDGQGGFTFTIDPAKVQARTQAAWTALRTERNARLAASDYTQLQDAHISQDKKDAWAAYRQALRDLPDETTNPLDAEWPPAPGTSVPVAPVTGSRLSSLLDHAGESVQEVEAEPVPEAEAVVEAPVVPEAEPVVESEAVVEAPVVVEAEAVVEPVVESEAVVEAPEVQEVVEVPAVEEVQEVVEPVVEVPEVQEVVEVPEVPEVQEAEPVQEVVEVPEPVPEVPEVPEVPASEPAPVELAASEPVV